MPLYALVVPLGLPLRLYPVQVMRGFLVGCVSLSLWIALGRQVCVSKRYSSEAVHEAVSWKPNDSPVPLSWYLP